MHDNAKKHGSPPIIDVTSEPVGSPVLAPPRIESNKVSNLMRYRVAMAVAIGIDLLQIGLFPLFSEGFLSPLEDILDGAAFVFFWWLLGWNFALLPGFIFKLVPFVDLAPTWTIAVALTIRSKKRRDRENVT